MKRPWLILGGGLIIGVAAYACVFLSGTARDRTMGQSDPSGLSWLRQEYHLTDEQFTKIEELHSAYLPTCVEMCRRIGETNARLQTLLAATNVVTPEIRQALADTARLRAECQGNMLAHFYAVARVMPPEQGRRYLMWVQRETLTPGPMIPAQPSLPSSVRKP